MSRVALFGQISEINDHLYLSGAGVLRPEKLRQKGIECVINATVEEPMYYGSGSDKIDSVKIRIEDSPYARLDHYFDLVADKIRAVKERGGKTLVHCVAGVSRSATLCIVYLMKYEHMSLRQAYHYVKAARPIIRPNLGFWKQMVDYEKKLRGHSTVSMMQVDNCPLPFPDVYSNELRKHIISNPGPAHNDPQLLALQRKQSQQQSQQGQKNKSSASLPLTNGKPTIIPVQFIGKSLRDGGFRSNRGSGINRPADYGGSHHHQQSSAENGGLARAINNAASSVLPWRAIAISPFLSPAPSRKPGSSVGGGGGRSSLGPRGGVQSYESNGGSLIGKLYGPSLFSAL